MLRGVPRVFVFVRRRRSDDIGAAKQANASSGMYSRFASLGKYPSVHRLPNLLELQSFSKSLRSLCMKLTDGVVAYVVGRRKLWRSGSRVFQP
jgi:hypothetical protein